MNYSLNFLILERVATIYTMHCASGLYIVDKMTEFFIPNSKDQSKKWLKRYTCSRYGINSSLFILWTYAHRLVAFLVDNRAVSWTITSNLVSLHQTSHIHMLKLMNFLRQLRLQGRKKLIDQDISSYMIRS